MTLDVELGQICHRMQMDPSYVGLMHQKRTFLLLNNPPQCGQVASSQVKLNP